MSKKANDATGYGVCLLVVAVGVMFLYFAMYRPFKRMQPTPVVCSYVDAYGRATATPCFPQPADCKLMTHVCRCPTETICWDATVQTPRPTGVNLSAEIAIDLETGKCFRAGSGPYFGSIIPTTCPHSALSLAQIRTRVGWVNRDVGAHASAHWLTCGAFCKPPYVVRWHFTHPTIDVTP